jgi:adenine phosphoribosyltransferase
MNLKQVIQSVPDWPEPGINFQDVTSLLQNPQAFQQSVRTLVNHMEDKGYTDIVAPDARGFLWGAPIALYLGIPLHIVRKPNKLPPPVKSRKYKCEYASRTLEIKTTAPLNKNSQVCIIDDVSATGGTALAITELLQSFDVSRISYGCVIDLEFLGGTEKLRGQQIKTYSVVTYDK